MESVASSQDKSRHRKQAKSVPTVLAIAIIALLAAIVIAVLCSVDAPLPYEGAVPP
jgi:hypothetical protein